MKIKTNKAKTTKDAKASATVEKPKSKTAEKKEQRGILKTLAVALGLYVFGKGKKPSLEITPAFTADERKQGRAMVLVLESEKGSVARDVLVVKDRIALTRCPSTGLDALIGLRTTAHELPPVKLTSGKLMTPEAFAKAAQRVTFTRQGKDAVADVVGYDANKKPDAYLAARHVYGKTVWHGQVESVSLPTNTRERVKGVEVVKA